MKCNLFFNYTNPILLFTRQGRKDRFGTKKTVETTSKTDSLIVTKIVSDFFKAFDERDLDRMEQLLTPQTKIIHHNGVTTDTKEMMEIIKATKNWHPRERDLSEFEIFGKDNFFIVGLINEVSFLMPEGKEFYKYNESWIFQKISNTWYPVRIHYSQIVQEEHTEEVQ